MALLAKAGTDRRALLLYHSAFIGDCLRGAHGADELFYCLDLSSAAILVNCLLSRRTGTHVGRLETPFSRCSVLFLCSAQFFVHRSISKRSLEGARLEFRSSIEIETFEDLGMHVCDVAAEAGGLIRRGVGPYAKNSVT